MSEHRFADFGLPTPMRWSHFAIPLKVPFRGQTVRKGRVCLGPRGWGESSPFPGFWIDEKTCNESAITSAYEQWPEPVRQSIPVHVTVPALSPEEAAAMVRNSGCRAAKVKVAEGDDEARIEAVRDALGPDGRLVIDANGGWEVDTAIQAIRRFYRYSVDLVEQPVSGYLDMAKVRKAVEVPLAADELAFSEEAVRRIVKVEAADVLVIKVQALGGIGKALRLIEAAGMPVVVSSLLETSVGLAAGVALAAALPELPYPCGLGTAILLDGDLVTDPLVPVDGEIAVRRPDADLQLLERFVYDPRAEDGRLPEDMGGVNKAANAGHALASVLVDELIRCGMRHACMSPGSRSTPLALALAARPELALHVSIDERSMSFLALGIAKGSSNPVALLTTSGSAAAHLHPAIIEASYAQVPLVVLTADRPPELRDTGAGQTIDQIKLYGDAVRWFCEVGVPEPRPEMVPYWRAIACRAWSESLWPAPGPVHLNLAFRNPLVPVADAAGFPFDIDGRPGGKPWIAAEHSPLKAAERTVDALAAELQSVEKGLIVVGTFSGDPAPVVGLAEALGWPLLAEGTSNCRRGPNSIAAYDALVRHPGFWERLKPELVLRFGSLGTSNKLAALLDSSVDQIAATGTTWLDPGRAVGRIVRADPSLLCTELQTRIEPRRSGPWLDSWLRAESRAEGAFDSLLSGHQQVTEPGIARALPVALPAGTNLMVASSMPVRDIDWFMRSSEQLRVLANRGANGIDGFVSSCLGVALSGNRSPTVGLSGDLSLLHDQNGLLLTSEHPPDVVFVVVNNNGGGIFSFLPQAAEPGFERLFGTPHNSDFAPLAKTYGCSYGSIHKPSDLTPSVTEALSSGGVHILEARTDRQTNVDIHNRLWAAVGEAIDAE